MRPRRAARWGRVTAQGSLRTWSPPIGAPWRARRRPRHDGHARRGRARGHGRSPLRPALLRDRPRARPLRPHPGQVDGLLRDHRRSDRGRDQAAPGARPRVRQGIAGRSPSRPRGGGLRHRRLRLRDQRGPRRHQAVLPRRLRHRAARWPLGSDHVHRGPRAPERGGWPPGHRQYLRRRGRCPLLLDARRLRRAHPRQRAPGLLVDRALCRTRLRARRRLRRRLRGPSRRAAARRHERRHGPGRPPRPPLPAPPRNRGSPSRDDGENADHRRAAANRRGAAEAAGSSVERPRRRPTGSAGGPQRSTGGARRESGRQRSPGELARPRPCSSPTSARSSRAKDADLASFRRNAEDKDKLIAGLNYHLLAVQRTIGWKLLERLRRLRDHMLPVDSRRRDVYWSIRRPTEVLLDEGPRAFFFKTRYKIRLKWRGQEFLVKAPRRSCPPTHSTRATRRGSSGTASGPTTSPG